MKTEADVRKKLRDIEKALNMDIYEEEWLELNSVREILQWVLDEGIFCID